MKSWTTCKKGDDHVSLRSKRILWVIVAFALIMAPAATAQSACSPFKIPAGPEWGDFTSNIWYAEGDVDIAGELFHVSVSIYPTDEYPVLRGKTGQAMEGTEFAVYDFGTSGSFITDVRFVVERNNPLKWYDSTMTATEIIRPGSGTGRFQNATGHFADQGVFWLTEPIDPNVLAGYGIFVTHGTICGVE